MDGELESKVAPLGFWSNSAAGPTTSFYTDLGDVRILLDTGLDPVGRMKAFGISPLSCTHLFLSHIHSDHSAGLPNFIFTRELLRRNVRGATADLEVLGLPDVIVAAKQLLALQYPERSFDVVWKPFSIGTDITLGADTTASVMQNDHTVTCAALRLLGSRGDVGFTSDSSPVDAQIDFFSDCELLLGESFGLEADVGSEINERGHSTSEDLGRLVKRAEVRAVMPFHFGAEYAAAPLRAQLLQASVGSGPARPIDPVQLTQRMMAK